jgi:hypothetical protein
MLIYPKGQLGPGVLGEGQVSEWRGFQLTAMGDSEIV